jgi:hypothetical protein
VGGSSVVGVILIARKERTQSKKEKKEFKVKKKRKNSK